MKVCTSSSRYSRTAATVHLESRGIFRHPSVKVMSLANLVLNFGLMIVVVGKRIIYLSGRELRELPEDLLDGEAALIVPHNGADWETGTANDWTTAAYPLFASDIRMITGFDSSCAIHTRYPVSNTTTSFR